MRNWTFVVVLAVFASSGWARADLRDVQEDGAYLDPRYPQHHHPVTLGGDAWKLFDLSRGFQRSVAPARSNVAALLRFMSPVRSQEARGSCSIFSAIALFEGMIARNGFVKAADADFSEEWLDYLISTKRLGGGSFSDLNFATLLESGAPEEEYMPYVGQEWADASAGMARERCGRFTGTRLTRCLRGHRDPELMRATDDALQLQGGALYDPAFQRARVRAARVRDRWIRRDARVSSRVVTTESIKALLVQGVPLTLDIDFYYGAWNHRGGEKLGIPRDMKNWAAGIVGYPAEGSVDRAKSGDKPTGHSVLVVGYDDSKVITTRQLMMDGTTKTISYRGVYYFKNSWGTGTFGVSADLDGSVMPGYGMIAQQYAHEYGSFFRMPVKFDAEQRR